MSASRKVRRHASTPPVSTSYSLGSATPATSSGPISRVAPLRPLSVDVVDGMTDALFAATGPAGRAAVIACLASEIYASVAWLAQHDDEELSSLQGFLEQAKAHSSRMSSAESRTEPDAGFQT